jgi:hypothetical protein
MSTDEDAQAWRCGQTLLRFFRHLDESDAEGVAREFAAHGAWHRRGECFEGQAAIRGAMAARPTDHVVRHLVTNILVRVTGDAAEAESYMTALAAPARDDGVVPQLTGPGALYACRTGFVREGEGWRIASHRAAPLLRAAAGGGH